MAKKNTKRGFTLVELIVVLVILAILAALLIPALTGYIDKARKSQVVAETRMLTQAVQTEMSTLYGSNEYAEQVSKNKNTFTVAAKDGAAVPTTNTSQQTIRDLDKRYTAIVNLSEVPSLVKDTGSFFALSDLSGKLRWVVYDDGKGYYGVYNFVKAYYEQHKQLPVGVNSQQMSTGSLSGFWIGLQRKKLKDNALSAERVSLLKEIGIEYGQLENSWNANYNAVKMFFDEHHHLPVQDASILLPSGIQSRNWITNQKKFLKTGTAPEDRVKLLNEIGIVAEADAPKPSKSKSEKVKKAAQIGSKPSRKVSKGPAEEWQECYDFVKRCLEESGTLPTGEKSTTMPNGVQTKSWIKQQRIALKESGLPADKVELLRAIGIVGNIMEQNWMRDYECIKAYVEEHHQLPVHKNSFELPDGGQSAQWIANRRTQMRNGTMPEERVKMLADIGIVYGSLAENWKESYNAIKAYLDEHGELPLKEASITLPTGSQSRWWIRNQTLMLHQGRQSEDKVKLLNEIGIV